MKKIVGLLSVICLSFTLTHALTLIPQVTSIMETDTVDIEQASSCTALTYDMRLGSRDARTGGQVTDLQAFLQGEGYLASDPTGYFGGLSKQAVQSFQKANRITPNGLVGPLTRAKIKAVSCSDNSPTVSTTPTSEAYTMTVKKETSSVLTGDVKINVLSPMGGETYSVGQIIPFSWTVDNIEKVMPASGTGLWTGVYMENVATGKRVFLGDAMQPLRAGSSERIIPASSEGVTTVPGEYRIRIYLYGSGEKAAGYSATFKVISGATPATSTVTLKAPILVSSSPISQPVVGGSSFGIATFKLSTATPGTNTIIRELRFTTTGTDAIESITVGGVTSAVISGGVTTISDLAIFVSSTGTDVPVSVKFAGFQNSTTGGFLTTSVSNVRLSLVYQEATNQGFVITNKDVATSESMTIVASKPTVSVGSLGSAIVLGSESKIGEFTVQADANGKIGLAQAQLNVSGIAINNFTMTSARVAFGTVSVPQVQTSISGNKITIHFAPDYEILPGQSKTFSVYAIVSGTAPTVSGSVASYLSREGFVWKDIIGGGTQFTGATLYNFPTNAYRTGESSTPTPDVKPTPVVSLVSDKTEVAFGEQVRLTWSSQNATFCTSSQLGVIATSGTKTESGTAGSSKTYTVSCTGQGGSASKSVSVLFKEQPISTPVSSKGTYRGYMNGSQFIGTDNITKDEALQNCKTNAANNPSSSVRCTWKASGGVEEEIYKQDSPSTTTTSTPVTTDGPKTNKMSCSRSVTTKYPTNGGHACYGVWDYGDEFGGDKDMCPQYAYGGGTGGCVIATPVCQSGYAVADSPIKPKNTNDASIWMNLETSKEAVSSQIIDLWVYRCTAAPQANTSTQSAVLGVSTMCTLITRNLHRGDESSQTTKLQEFLYGNGFLTEKPTGFYGDKTVAAVKDYQGIKGLSVTGMAYEATRAVIEKDSCR